MKYFNIWLIIIFLVFSYGFVSRETFAVSQATSEETSTSHKHSLSLDGYLGGRSVTDETLRSQAAGFRLRGNYTTELAPQWNFHLLVDSQLEDGASTALQLKEYGPKNEIALREGALNFSPTKALAIEAGVVDQARWQIPLLFTTKGLPGLVESLHWEMGSGWQGSLSSEQAIPTGNQQLKFVSSPNGKTSGFFSEQLALSTSVADGFSAEAAVMHFSFSNLGPSVAQDSRFLGNTVFGLGADNATFLYDYSGWATRFVGSKLWSNGHRSRIGFAFLNNWRAPVQQNQAWMAEASTAFLLSSTLSFQPEFQLFRAESDSSPAVYSHSGLAYKNRSGWRAGMEWGFLNAGIFLMGHLTQAHSILNSPFQGDFLAVDVGVIKKYEIF